ncbi:MAG: hypothetical protein COV07_01730 [Candidatus Vogelbacteria bacterium CG10_big_fil_rev_8_21_14_0_10_45_14]|uniref:Purine nucleoside phosphorylase n=1 Tax=Candidatus Vogelbacteria bacterium CG10_big_fil_rev_8_21_14_0_10_45_14 TaxID=1975042 RepID=A0A2H0RK55_9BACT|nr:MAG: hypothetical protein COV07_01730 [Candidatus Vogelbacteria bacterium CG10_big_fil_rev_8_21_14_0_10_45_14]
MTGRKEYRVAKKEIQLANIREGISNGVLTFEIEGQRGVNIGFATKNANNGKAPFEEAVLHEIYGGDGSEAQIRVAKTGSLHGNKVMIVGDKYFDNPPETLPDALITESASIALAAGTADCPVVVLYDPIQHVLGIAHSGWRGTSKNIVEHVLNRMNLSFGVVGASVVAFVGPYADPNRYIVDDDVGEAFRKTEKIHGGKMFPPLTLNTFYKEIEDGNGKYLLDLGLAIRFQLIACGLQASHIGITKRRSISDPSLFSSRVQREEGSNDIQKSVMMAVLQDYRNEINTVVSPSLNV